MVCCSFMATRDFKQSTSHLRILMNTLSNMKSDWSRSHTSDAEDEAAEESELHFKLGATEL